MSNLRCAIRQYVLGLTVSLLLVSASTSNLLHAADDAVDTLLDLLPDRVNSIVLIDVSSLLDTPLAKSENWRDQQRQQPLASDLPFPMNARMAIRGMEVYPEGRAITESYNLLLLGNAADMDRIADAEGSKVELLAGKRAVLAPGKGYFVDFGKQRLGVFSPAYRQQVGQWVREDGASEATAEASYLINAIKSSQGQFVMALDLQDVFGPAQVTDWLNNSRTMGEKPKAIEAFASTLSSIQGIRLEVTVGDDAQGTLSVDFQKPLGASQAETLKSLLMEVLARQGYAFAEFASAPPKVDGKTLQIQAPLQKESLKDLVELGLVPMSKGTAEPSASLASGSAAANPQDNGKPQDNSKAVQQATFAYYTGVAKLIDSASARVRNEPENFPRLANTYDSLAKRISGFSLKDVDPEILKFGNEVASASRALAASYRGASVNVDALNKSITYEVNTNPYQSLYNQNYNHGYYWGGTTVTPGTYQVKSNKEQVRQEQVQAVTAEDPKRQQLFLMMQDDRQKARQYLNEKYNADPEAK